MTQRSTVKFKNELRVKMLEEFLFILLHNVRNCIHIQVYPRHEDYIN